jgi:hypothetical protein
LCDACAEQWRSGTAIIYYFFFKIQKKEAVALVPVKEFRAVPYAPSDYGTGKLS